MNKLPLARIADIVVQKIDSEILIYDVKTHKIYNLNETSAAIYDACDGTTSFNELKARHSYTDELIFLALDELQKANLIEDKSFASPLTGMSRREAIKKVGLGSMIALPIISMLTAPTAANAQSSGVCTSFRGNSCECFFPPGGIQTSCFDADCDDNCRCIVIDTGNCSDPINGTIRCSAFCDSVTA